MRSRMEDVVGLSKVLEPLLIPPASIFVDNCFPLSKYLGSLLALLPLARLLIPYSFHAHPVIHSFDDHVPLGMASFLRLA